VKLHSTHRQHLEQSLSCIQKEAELLSFDAELLSQFSLNNNVRIQARLFTPRYGVHMKTTVCSICMFPGQAVYAKLWCAHENYGLLLMFCDIINSQHLRFNAQHFLSVVSNACFNAQQFPSVVSNACFNAQHFFICGEQCTL
jgi:hypothetical protein